MSVSEALSANPVQMGGFSAAVPSRDLKNALAWLAKTHERSVKIPILTCVLIEARGDTLRLTVTDLDISAIVDVPRRGDGDGAAVVSFAALRDAARAAERGGEVEIAHYTAEHLLRVGAATLREELFSPDDWLHPPALSGDWAEMSAAPLSAALGAVHAAMNDEDTRFYLKGVYFDRDGGALAATDGHRLHVAPLAAPFDGIVPRKAVAVLRAALSAETKRVARGDPPAVAVRAAHARAQFICGAYTIQTKLIDAKFPSYRRVIPVQHKTTMTLNRSDLAEALAAMVRLRVGRMWRVTVEARGGAGVTLTARSDDADLSRTLDATVDGEAFTAHFDTRLLLDALDTVSGDDVVIWASDARSPIKLASSPAPGQPFAVVMPVRY